jgi:hypothetical protein
MLHRTIVLSYDLFHAALQQDVEGSKVASQAKDTAPNADEMSATLPAAAQASAKESAVTAAPAAPVGKSAGAAAEPKAATNPKLAKKAAPHAIPASNKPPAAEAAAPKPVATAIAASIDVTQTKPVTRKATVRSSLKLKTVAAPAAKRAYRKRNTTNKPVDIRTEGVRKMKNETSKVVDSVQAVLGDVNERAKVSLQRNTRIAEELSEFGKGNVQAIVASSKIAANGLETVGQEVAEYARKSFEDASVAFKSFAEVTSATDFFRLQGEFVRSQFDSFVSEAAKLSETMVKLAGDAAAPLTGRYLAAAEKQGRSPLSRESALVLSHSAAYSK